MKQSERVRLDEIRALLRLVAQGASTHSTKETLELWVLPELDRMIKR